MAASSEYSDYVLGQLAGAGTISHREMFGGVGIYIDTTFCAIIGSSNRFYLRIGQGNVADFEAEGMDRFSGGKGKGTPYYEVPEHVLEDPALLTICAGKARDEALAAKKVA